MIRKVIAGALLVLSVLALGACGKNSQFGWSHSDWGYCERTGKHKHNDHIFIGDYHDHTLCEWARFE